MGPDGLTEKQRRFVNEYLVDLNATQAAIRTGYSPRTAKQQGARLLTNAAIAAAVTAASAERSERTQITADRVLEEYAAIAFAQTTDFVTWKEGPWGTEIEVRPSDQIDGRVVAGIKPVMLGKIRIGAEVKLYDKLAALDKLGQHLGMWKKEPEAVGSGGLDVVIDRRGAS